jgi:3-methyladenine DNA glycosylase AlkD
MPEARPINPNALAKEIEERLRALEEIRVENVRIIRREFSKRLAKATPKTVIDIALRLVERAHLIPRFVGYELICHHPEALASLGQQELEQLGEGIDSWGDVDPFACYLAGPAWRERQVPDGLILAWARSDNRWWRRAALVSTVALNNKARGGSGDTRRTLKISSVLVADRDDMVVKALSWALRELAKRDREAVTRFLTKYEQKLPARVLREVHHKLTTGLKNPKRRRV